MDRDFDEITSLKTLCFDKSQEEEEKCIFLIFLLHLSHLFILVTHSTNRTVLVRPV